MVLSAGGYEVNPVADYVIRQYGMQGALAFKFATAAFVILCCEIIGRHQDRLGRFVASIAIAVPAMAATLGYILVMRASGAGFVLF